jgi:hypothetical protein
MTGKQIKGKGFGGALRYNLDKVERKVAEVLDHNFARVEAKSILREVMLVKVQRPNLQKYFYHTSINFPEPESLSNDKMKQIGREYLEMNGFNQHQYIMFRHRDADHPHLHILVSRIGYDGSALSDSNDYARSERVIRALEKKHGLTPTISSKEARERSITQGEYQMMKRINDASQKIKIQIAIQNILNDRPGLSTEDFIKSLEAHGVNVLFNQAKTGHISGISYGLDGFLITGSKLGNAYKWTLKNTIDYEQERDGQQFTRQMTGQEVSSLNQQEVLLILKEVQNLYSQTEARTRECWRLTSKITADTRSIQEKLECTNERLDQLNTEIERSATFFRRSQKKAFWERYSTAILVGLIAALVTNIIWLIAS